MSISISWLFGSTGIFEWDLACIGFNKPTNGVMPNGVEIKAERREQSGEKHAK